LPFYTNPAPEPWKSNPIRARAWEVDVEDHPEVLVLAYLEEVGIYVKQRLIADEALLEFIYGLIVEAWDRLRGVVEQTRRTQNPHAWESLRLGGNAAMEAS